MEILSIDEGENFIVFRNKNEGQVVRLFYTYSNKVAPDEFIRKTINPPIVCISRLYVDSSYRRNGWATFVMNFLIEKYKDSSFLVNAFSDDVKYMSNEILISFYARFGFEKLKPTEEGMLLIRKK